jgi:hypothetical protein
MQGDINEESLNFAAKLTLRYSDSIKSVDQIKYGIDFDQLADIIVVELENDETLKKFII